MASISRDKRGNRTIQVICADGKRRSIRLGSWKKKPAETVKSYVEALNAAATSRTAWDRETAEWVGGLDSVLYDKLAAVGQLERAFVAGRWQGRRHALAPGVGTPPWRLALPQCATTPG